MLKNRFELVDTFEVYIRNDNNDYRDQVTKINITFSMLAENVFKK